METKISMTSKITSNGPTIMSRADDVVLESTVHDEMTINEYFEHFMRFLMAIGFSNSTIVKGMEHAHKWLEG